MKKLLVFGQADGPHMVKWTTPFIGKYEVHVVSLHPPKNESMFAGAIHHYIPAITGTKLDYLLKYFYLKSLFKKINPDLIHSHYISSYGVLAAAIAPKVKKVVTIWGSDLMLARNNPVLRFLIDNALMKYDWIITPSEFSAEVLYKIGIDRDKVSVFQYGIDTDECDHYKVEKAPGVVHLLSTRTWAPLYNIDTVVDAFKLAYEKNKNLKLTMIGFGDPEGVQKLTERVDSHPAITILGKVPKDKLLNEVWKSQLFISIPESDGMPLSVLEALYCHSYPILSDIPANCEMLRNGVGIIEKTITAEAVSEAILKAAEDYKTADLDKNVAFVEEKANYKKNLNYVGLRYLKILGL